MSDTSDTTDTGEGAEAAGDSETKTTPEAEPEPDIQTEVAGVVPAQSEPAPVAASAPPPAQSSGPSAFGLVFGGLLAGAIGFLVATFAVPEGWPNPPETGPDPMVAEQISGLEGQIAALGERLDAAPVPAVTEAGTVDLGPIEGAIGTVQSTVDGLAERLDALEGSLSGLDQRLAAIEAEPRVVGPDGSAAMEAQLEAFRTELDQVTEAARAEIEDAQARADRIEAEALAAAEAARRQAAIADITAALESGTAFADAAAELGDLPAALSSVASEGVATLASLQAVFPDRARAALRAADPAATSETATDRFAAFLRRQTNARSLAPRDGDDPDAVLSRAEAALSEGDLSTALSELEALPDDARAAMDGWIAQASARADAVAAAAELN